MRYDGSDGPQPFIPLPPMSPVGLEVETWMQRKRRQMVVARIEAQIAKSRRRRARRALVELADLEALLR